MTTTAPAAATTQLHVHEVVVTHGDRVLVDVADVRLEPGRAVTVVGESGSGKSLLAHAVMGTLPRGLRATGRTSTPDGRQDLADPRGRRTSWGRHLALLPQEPVLALDPTARVGGQVAEGVRGSGRRRARAAAAAALSGVGLPGAEHAFPHTLSGGMAQRVAFAAATVGGARVLVADEPSTGLDAAARDVLAGLLRSHLDRGGALLTITHDLELARRLGGEVLVMHRATVVERGEAADVLSSPTHPWTARLLAAEPSRWRHDRWPAPPPPPDGATPLLGAAAVTTRLGGRTLFADLDLQVHPGDRVAVTGPSGSGKTTLGDVLLRVRRPDAGQVTHDEALGRGRLQKLYQDPVVAFPPHVPLEAALVDVQRRHRVDARRTAELLDAVRIDPAMLRRRPGEVSGGELQRISLVRALLLDPALLFADEPTSRLDLLTQEETMACLLDQVVERGCALLLVTHDEALAAATTTRRVVLDGG